MSGKSWEPDPKLTRSEHDWEFAGITKNEWGFSVEFFCKNHGCPTRVYMPIKPDSAGLCFDTIEAKQLTDRDGNDLHCSGDDK
jgi:hypothetical protein